MIPRTLDSFFDDFIPADNEADAELLLTNAQICNRISDHTGQQYELMQIDTIMRERKFISKAVKELDSFRLVWLINLKS